jgi:hypothetical protein
MMVLRILFLLHCLLSWGLGQGPFGISASSYLGGTGDDDAVLGSRILSNGEMVLAANIGNATPGGLAPTLLGSATAASSGALIRLSADGRQVLGVTRCCSRVYDLAVGSNDELLLAAGTEGLLKLNATASTLLWQQLSGSLTIRVDVASTGHVVALVPSTSNEPWGTGRVHLFDAAGTALGDFPGRYNTQDVCIHGPSQTIIFTGYRITSAWDPNILLPVHIAYLRAVDFTGALKWSAYDWAREPFLDGTNASPAGADPALLSPRYLNRYTNNMADTRGYRCIIGRDGQLYAAFEAAGGNHIFRYSPHDLAVAGSIVGGDGFHQFVNTGSSHKLFVGRYSLADGNILLGQQYCPVFKYSNGPGANTLRIQNGDIAANELGQLSIGGSSASGLPIPYATYYVAKAGQVAFNPANPNEYTGGAYFWTMSADFTTRLYVTRLSTGGWTHSVDTRLLAGETAARFCWGGQTNLGSPTFTTSAVQAQPGNGKADGTFAVLGGSVVSLPTGQAQLTWSGTGSSVVTQRSRWRDMDEFRQITDLDGDGPDDSITGYEFRTDIPLSPSGGGYSTVPFYGGYRCLGLNSTTLNLTDNHVDGTTAVARVESGSTAAAQTHAVIYWHAADAAGHVAGDVYRFNRYSELSLSHQGDTPSRWLVREGTTWYVSEATLAASTKLNFLSDHTDGAWAPWNLTPDMDFPAEKARFAERDFSNITAVGFLVDRDAYTSGRSWTRWNGFRASLAKNTVPAAAPMPLFTMDKNSGARNLLVNFTAQQNAGPAGFYQWDFDNGVTSGGPLSQASYNAAGNYLPTLTVWDGLRQPASMASRVSVASSLGGALGKQVVAYGGDAVNSSSTYARLDTVTLDLDGDGGSDRLASVPFSSTEPLTPSIRGTRWFGGLTATSRDTTTFDFSNAEIAQSSNGDYPNIRTTSAGTGGTTVHAVCYVDKADFLGVAASVPVAWETGSRLKIANVVNNENAGPLRWLVRNAGQFYVSEATFSGAAEYNVTSDTDHGRWAVFDPEASLNFDAAGAVFTTRTFLNLTAFGFVLDRDAAGTARVWWNFRDFEVLAKYNAAPTPVPAALFGTSLVGAAPLWLTLSATEPNLAEANWEIISPSGEKQFLNGLQTTTELSRSGSYQIKLSVTDIYGQTASSQGSVTATAAQTYANWLVQQGLPANTTPMADGDQDGLSNGIEYLVGSRPQDYTWVRSQSSAEGQWSIRFPVRKSQANWRLEFSTRLNSGSWYPLQPQQLCPVADLGEFWEMEAQLPLSQPRVFVRLALQ